jgi:hypothetical protein
MVLLVLAIGGGLQVGTAAGLTTTAALVGAGSAPVTACDGDGFTFRPTIDTSGRITTVSTTGINVACSGGTLRITVMNGAASVGSGSTSLPSTGFSGTADVAINPQPASSGVSAVYSVVEGP